MSFFARTLRRWYRNIPKNEAGNPRFGFYFRRLIFRLILWFLGISIGFTLLFAVLPVPFTLLMVKRTLEQSFSSSRTIRFEKEWASYHRLPTQLRLAMVCAEDQNFNEHMGFDLEAIEKAYEYNKTHKQKRGASTISQQTAKNVFLWPSRSWLRKGLEVYFTFLIEVFWSKKRIMTVYLNVIEFGDGVYGAQAAARHFFGKDATALTREECALLASVLPNPLRYSVDKPSSYVRQRQRLIARKMRNWRGEIDF